MEETKDQPNTLPTFTKEEFLESKFNSIFNDFKDLDLRKAQHIIGEKIIEFEIDSIDWRVARFFSIIFSVHFDVNRHEVYSPMMVTGEGQRTLIPSDIPDQQWDEINSVIENLECPLLRAFVADMMWGCNRKRWKLPIVASQGFCIAIEDYLAGRRNDEYEPPEFVSNSAIDLLERSFQLLAAIGKKNDIPEHVKKSWDSLWQATIKKEHAIAFVRMADLGLNNQLINHSSVAKSAEELVTEKPQNYAMAEKRVWALAAYCYEKLQEPENRLRCRLQMVAQTLRMRDATTQAMTKASWTRDAIQELRQIGGQKEQIRVLWNELLEYQDAAMDELGHFSLPLDVASQVEGTRKAFSGKSLSEMLKYFCALSRPIEIEDLKKSALEVAKNSPLMAMIGMSRTDREGRIISTSPAASFENEPSEEWFKNQFLQHLDIYYLQVVGGSIYPAINIICEQHAVYEKYLYAIVERSPFIPLGYRENYAKGFWMIFQGDFIGAAYTLIPMLENSIRYVLSTTGQDSSKMLPDSTQEDRSLSGLLEGMRTELEEIFGANTINEIDLLFNFKGGPSLRHEVAHGKLTSGSCFHHSTIYGCWIIYRLACLPMFRNWEADIEPVLEALA